MLMTFVVVQAGVKVVIGVNDVFCCSSWCEGCYWC